MKNISSKILEFANESAKQAGLSNFSTKALDGEQLGELAGKEFDAVISRVGLIYFPDQQKALTHLKHITNSVDATFKKQEAKEILSYIE